MTKKLFRTELLLPPGHSLDDAAAWCLVGSCFAEEMATKLDEAGFYVAQNPFGVLYNPISIAECLQAIIDHKVYQPADLSIHNDLYFAWSHHGRYKGMDEALLLESINGAINISRAAIGHDAVLTITWGTATVYRLRANGRIVGNCHKFPSADFEKYTLQPSDIYDVYYPLFKNLLNAFPAIRVVMSISPVRHIRDGFVQNQHSKSTLFVALHQLLADFPDRLTYFPAYEIVMDELRDYRFYKQDMIHPTDEAVDYIWERFCQTHFSTKTNEMIREIEKYKAMYRHRPLFPNSDAHKAFQVKLEATKKALQSRYPNQNLENVMHGQKFAISPAEKPE